MIRVSTITSPGRSSDIKVRVEINSNNRLSRDEVDAQIKDLSDRIMQALKLTLYHNGNLSDMEVR